MKRNQRKIDREGAKRLDRGRRRKKQKTPPELLSPVGRLLQGVEMRASTEKPEPVRFADPSATAAEPLIKGDQQ
jgi:hypothetical protein